MNFYIGNKINEYDEYGQTVEVSDDLLSLIYRLRDKSECDLSALYTINPYEDVFVDFEQVKKIKEICWCLLLEVEGLYIPDKKYMIDSLTGLLCLSDKAILQKKGLVSIGD